MRHLDLATACFPSHVDGMPRNIFALRPEQASAPHLSINVLSLDPLNHTYTLAQKCNPVSRFNLPLLSTAVVPALALLDEQTNASSIKT